MSEQVLIESIKALKQVIIDCADSIHQGVGAKDLRGGYKTKKIEEVWQLTQIR